MTERPANDEMVQGYRDGFDLNNPDPSDVEFTRSGNDETNSIYELFPDELGLIWRKMIDAILNEPTKE